MISVPRELIIYVVLYTEEDTPSPKKNRLRGRLVKYIPSLCRSLGFCFPCHKLCERNTILKMFLHEAKQLVRTFLLLRPCSPKNSKTSLLTL